MKYQRHERIIRLNWTIWKVQAALDWKKKVLKLFERTKQQSIVIVLHALQTGYKIDLWHTPSIICTMHLKLHNINWMKYFHWLMFPFWSFTVRIAHTNYSIDPDQLHIPFSIHLHIAERVSFHFKPKGTCVILKELLLHSDNKQQPSVNGRANNKNQSTPSSDQNWQKSIKSQWMKQSLYCCII